MNVHEKDQLLIHRRLFGRAVVLFAYHLNAFVRLDRGSVEVIV